MGRLYWSVNALIADKEASVQVLWNSMQIWWSY